MIRCEPPAFEAQELPELLARVVEACGPGPALSFAQAFGGRVVYMPLPEALGEDHPFAQALGLGCARKLAAALGPGRHLIPMGPTATSQRQRQTVRRLLLEGRSWNTVAAVAGVHVRTVARVAAELRLPPEPDLFA